MTTHYTLAPISFPDSTHTDAIAGLWTAACGPNLAASRRLAAHNTQTIPGLVQAGRFAWQNDEPIGCVLASVFTGEPAIAPPDLGWIDAIAVLPDTQRQGMGTALLAWATTWLAEQGCRTVRLGGSLHPFAPGLPVELYRRATAAGRERGVPVVVDARREALEASLAARPTVVKPNRAELANTVGRPVDSRQAMHDAMAMLCGRGAQNVVCTRGRDGSSLCHGCEVEGPKFWEVSTPPIEMVSPVGSGDAYAAGLAAGLSDGVEVAEAVKFAAACGAANAMSLHAGHLDPAAAERLFRDVRVVAVE